LEIPLVSSPFFAFEILCHIIPNQVPKGVDGRVALLAMKCCSYPATRSVIVNRRIPLLNEENAKTRVIFIDLSGRPGS
jgi:hypothetical protein